MDGIVNKDSFHSEFYRCGLFSSGGREQGFTLTELLIAMAMASIVAMSGFSLFIDSNWSYQVQESVGEAQQNARVAMDRISRDLRTAGFGLPDTIDPAILGFTSPITASDATGYDGSDKITILGIGYEAGSLVGVAENKQGNSYICYSPATTGEKIIVGTTVAEYRKSVSIDGIFFATLDTSTASVPCDSGNGKTLPLSWPSALKGDFVSGKVYIIQAVEYSIATDISGCSAANPCLVSKDYSNLRGSGRQLLAENIEDIQFAYGMGGSGTIDYGPSYTKEDFLDSPSGSIRAVRATVSARTRNKDSKGLTFYRAAIENHAESADDNYRRRILTRIVKTRN